MKSIKRNRNSGVGNKSISYIKPKLCKISSEKSANRGVELVQNADISNQPLLPKL